MNQAAVFLDRDGVLVHDCGYVHRVEDLLILPGVTEGLKRFQQVGYRLVVVTNQSGIARGLYSEHDYQAFTAAMQERLATQGVSFDAILHCPHLPDARVAAYAQDCECRKPKPGMLLRAAAQLGIDRSRSLMVGDRLSDLQAGRAAGIAKNYLMSVVSSTPPAEADGVFADLDSLSRHVLREARHEH